jgi:PIN domain nuclease of toxin-antitoxin system
VGAWRARAALGDSAPFVEAGDNVVSVASYWEVVIKVQKNLLSIGDSATRWRRATELTSAHILHIRPHMSPSCPALPMLHKDPFDRILIAQAKTEDLGIVTTDESIGKYSVQTIW